MLRHAQMLFLEYYFCKLTLHAKLARASAPMRCSVLRIIFSERSNCKNKLNKLNNYTCVIAHINLYEDYKPACIRQKNKIAFTQKNKI